VLLLGPASYGLGAGLLCLCFATAPFLFGLPARLSFCRLPPRFFT